jgi:hypothetical protein
MKTIELDVRGGSIKRYVLEFKGTNLGRFSSFFSVGFESSDSKTAYDKITENAKKTFNYEVCSVQDPENKSWYTLIERKTILAEDLFNTLANILVRFNAIDEGTPVKFIFKEFGNVHSVVVMNAGLPTLAMEA